MTELRQSVAWRRSGAALTPPLRPTTIPGMPKSETMTEPCIAPEDPRQPDGRRLIALSDAAMQALYPAESNHLVGVDALAAPGTVFLVARRNGEALGMGLAVQSTLDAGTSQTTLEFKISLVRPITTDTGEIRAEGTVLNCGRRIGTAEGRVTDAQGRLLAHGTTTCLIFPA